MLLASPPENIAGKIEVRGIGLVEMTHVSDVPVALVVQLFDVVDRMPPTPELRVMAGISIPVMKIAPKESSAPIKVEMAIKTFGLDKSESGEGGYTEETKNTIAFHRALGTWQVHHPAHAGGQGQGGR